MILKGDQELHHSDSLSFWDSRGGLVLTKGDEKEVILRSTQCSPLMGNMDRIVSAFAHEGASPTRSGPRPGLRVE